MHTGNKYRSQQKIATHPALFVVAFHLPLDMAPHHHNDTATNAGHSKLQLPTPTHPALFVLVLHLPLDTPPHHQMNTGNRCRSQQTAATHPALFVLAFHSPLDTRLKSLFLAHAQLPAGEEPAQQGAQRLLEGLGLAFQCVHNAAHVAELVHSNPVHPCVQFMVLFDNQLQHLE